MTHSAEAPAVDGLPHNKMSAVLKAVTTLRACTREKYRGI